MQTPSYWLFLCVLFWCCFFIRLYRLVVVRPLMGDRTFQCALFEWFRIFGMVLDPIRIDEQCKFDAAHSALVLHGARTSSTGSCYERTTQPILLCFSVMDTPTRKPYSEPNDDSSSLLKVCQAFLLGSLLAQHTVELVQSLAGLHR